MAPYMIRNLGESKKRVGYCWPFLPYNQKAFLSGLEPFQLSRRIRTVPVGPRDNGLAIYRLPGLPDKLLLFPDRSRIF